MFCFLPRRPYRLVQCRSMQKECFSKTVGPKESDTAWSGATLARKALPSMPTWVSIRLTGGDLHSVGGNAGDKRVLL